MMKQMERAGRESPPGQEEERFPFVDEVLALDLVNTEIIVRGKQRDLLAMS